MNEPILHIYQDGSEFFAAHPDFADLQSSRVVWLKTRVVLDLLHELESDADLASLLGADPLTNELLAQSKGDK